MQLSQVHTHTLILLAYKWFAYYIKVRIIDLILLASTWIGIILSRKIRILTKGMISGSGMFYLNFKCRGKKH